MKATSKIMAKGLVVLPKAMREQVDLKVGDVVEFSARGRVLEIRPKVQGLAVFAGRFADTPSAGRTDRALAEVRGKKTIPKRGASRLE